MFGRFVRRAASPLVALLTVFTIIAPLGSIASAQTPPTEGTPPQVIGEPLTPGTYARVQTNDASCLRLRDEPSLNGQRVSCVPHGRTVLVMPATTEADGYRWQLVEWRGQTAWAADFFLRPADGPSDDACHASTIHAGITGEVPSNGGLGLVVWGGGTMAGLETAALQQDCVLTSVWASRPDGGFVAYNFSVPDFVNDEWRAIVSDVMATGTPLLIVCNPPGSTIANVSSVPLPAVTGSAPVQTGTEAPPEVQARAAIVVDEASGEVLFEHNAHESLPIASLTKIATAILALEGTVVDNWVPVDDVDYRQMPGSSVMGVVPGDCFTVRDLLYGLLLPSGNDAALAIARYQSGSDEAFVDEMNTLLSRLGLNETHFTDPHGLGSETHLSSAYDVAMLSRYAMTQIPLFRQIVQTPTWTANGDRALNLRNVNSFISQYEGADGVKTGYTEQAGRTLSASATRDGHRLYAVVLNDNNRYSTAEALIDWAFKNYTWE